MEKVKEKRPRKKLEKKVWHQPVNGKGTRAESVTYSHGTQRTVSQPGDSASEDKAREAYAVQFDQQVALEYADEDPDRIRIAVQ